MALTTAQFQAWLESNSAIRCLLVEVVVNIDGTETLLYLSNRNYNTGPSESPANTHYAPWIQTSLSFNQSLPLDGTASLSYGDIAIDNTNGDRDDWLNYIWANREINIYMGDVTFARADFTKIYSGYVSDIASSGRNTLNLSIRDLLQRLNTPVTATLVGGTDQNKEQLRPLVFGEVHNITPVLVDAANLVYMVHNGPIERIIEVRDNGVPLALTTGYTVNLSAGTFTLLKSPAGTITCSVQGERSAINHATGGVISHSYSTQALTWTRSGTTATITHTTHGFSNGASINISASSATTTIPLGVYTINVINANSYSITCLSPENLVLQSDNLGVSPWSGCSATISTETYSSSTFWTLAKVSITTSEYRGQSLGTIQAGSHIVKIALLAGNNTNVSVGLYDETSNSWGANVDSSATILEGPGVLGIYAGGLFNITGLSATIPTVITITRNYLTSVSAGIYIYPGTPNNNVIGTSIKVAAIQVNKGTSPNPYYSTTTSRGTPSGTNTISSYANTVAEIVQIVIQKYGTTPVTSANIDLATFNTFDTANPQPIGIYLTTNTNVISLCQDLAASVGAQFTSNRQGLVTLLKLDSPTGNGTTRTITDTDILQGSCSIEQKVPVQGVVKLGYCKNWTIQTQLLTGIPEAHKTMLALEYLTATAADNATLLKYNLSAEPQIKNTYLTSNTPTAYVSTEAARLLSLWSTPRFIYKLEGAAKFLTLNLGDMVSLTHYRFGLQNSKYGQVVSIAVNWDTGRVNLGILV